MIIGFIIIAIGLYFIIKGVFLFGLAIYEARKEITAWFRKRLEYFRFKKGVDNMLDEILNDGEKINRRS